MHRVDMFCLHYVFLPRLNKCLRDFQESWNNHGLPDTGEHVVVPRVSLIPCQGLLHQLEQSINPLQSCNDYGKGLYIQTVHIIGHHLLPGCDECFKKQKLLYKTIFQWYIQIHQNDQNDGN